MYESYFELSRRPFASTPDVASYYPAPTHEEALALLKCCIEERNGVGILTGEPGTGKTLLLHLLLESLEPNVSAILITNTHTQTVRSMLQAMLYDLSLPFTAGDEHELRLQFTDVLMERFSQGQRTLLFIDEAQHLTLDQLEELRLLTNLEGRDERAIQVLLIGQPDLMKTLQTPQIEAFRQRIAAVGKVNPLDDEQTIEYVRTQITEVGGLADSIFTAGALSEICDVTGGLPRRINQICHRALVLAYAHESGMVDGQYIRAAAEQILMPMPKQEKSVFHSHHLQAVYEPERRPDRVVEESTIVREAPNVIEVGAGIDDEDRVRIVASDDDEQTTIVEPEAIPASRSIRERESRFQRMYSR